MPTTVLKIKNNTGAYNPKSRYKINDSVIFNNNTYQNISGYNSQPTPISLDWILTNESILALNTKVLVNGNLFYLIKHPNNNTPGMESTLEDNDMIVSGWWDTTTFWTMAMYLGGNVNLIASWNPINPISELPLI